MKCAICGKVVMSPKGLGQHVSKFHNIEKEEYAILALGPKWSCPCGAQTRFLSITLGWAKSCASCSAKKSKAELKDDPEKWSRFIEKTSIAVKDQWAQDQTSRKSNISIAKCLSASRTTKEERKEKFGWMNNPDITQEKKREVWEKSLYKWYTSLSDVDREKFHVYRAEQILKSTNEFLVFDANLPEEHESNQWATSRANTFLSFSDLDKIFGV